MLAAPIPANDVERLAALHALDLLDTPDEERFDRIVRVAASAFGVPIAYISLVDENRQWLKAQCGLSTRQTGRAESFCGHAILGDGPLVIPDAQADPRFADNPLVLGEPFVRFYAGFPLRGPGGHAVGTLCLVDRTPRELDTDGLATFHELAALAEREINLVDLVRTQSELLDTQNALLTTRERLADELAEAESYVRSLLPIPLDDKHVRTAWKFAASSQLGGDIFGYRWLDAERLAMWVLDVCGHGVGASLLSITAHDALRGRLRATHFERPDEVLASLNQAFPMEEHQDRFFTAWYGVWNVADRELRYACAGHPPALAVLPTGDVERLGCPCAAIGAMPEMVYSTETRHLPVGTRLYLYSDGAFEVESEAGAMLGLAGLEGLLLEAHDATGDARVEQVFRGIEAAAGPRGLEDDLSLLEIELV